MARHIGGYKVFYMSNKYGWLLVDIVATMKEAEVLRDKQCGRACIEIMYV